MISIAPLSLKKIHIVGIGGIGMSGIADVLHHLDYEVQGSDASVGNANVQRLRDKGIQVFDGHAAAHISKDIGVVVHSTAVQPNNPELRAALEFGVPVISRAEMLSELMRFYLTVAVSGTHGKTTTTSLVGQLMKDLAPTIINGGIINAAGSNVALGTGNWMVVEADESDGTFARVPAIIALVTNIDPEHLDYYGDFTTLKQAFTTFVERVAFYGFSVLCYDHPVVRDLADSLTDVRIYTYGLHPNAMVRGETLQETQQGMRFDVRLSEVFCEEDHETVLKDIVVPLHGTHNVLNALAAITVALKMNIQPDRIRELFQSYKGVQRRFTETACLQGVRYIDDYAHHPTEIKAVLQAARGLTDKKIVVVFQPHRYSRLKNLFQEFLEALSACDHLFVMPVYAAGETAEGGVTETHVVAEFKSQYNRPCEGMTSMEEGASKLKQLVSDGDVVLFLGAGDITKWAYEVPKLIEAQA